jgi:hypothetical protein
VHDYGQQQIVFEVRGLPTQSYKESMVGIIVEGSEGYLVATSYNDATVFDRDGKAIKTFSGGDDQNHYNNFQDAVRARDYKLLNADIEEGHLSSALCHLANISMQLGEEIDAVDVSAKLKDMRGPGNLTETWQRTADHLKNNDVLSYRVKVGPQLQLDPVAEQFQNNATANAMLTREYRAGYELPSEVSV